MELFPDSDEHIAETLARITATRPFDTRIDGELHAILCRIYTWMERADLTLDVVQTDDDLLKILRKHAAETENLFGPIVDRYHEVPITAERLEQAGKHLKAATAAAVVLNRFVADPAIRAATILLKAANRDFRTVCHLVTKIERLAQS